MKSKLSPSAPLNLCAPVGVTGTTLPASPEGVACVTAESVCLDCGVSHKDQIALFPVNSTVIALCDIPAPHEASTRNIEKGTLGHISDHCDDGRAFVRFDVGGCHTFHKPEGYIAPHPSTAEPVKVPASPVKDTPAFAVDSLSNPPYTTGEHKGLSVVDFDAPASPVDSVGAAKHTPLPWYTRNGGSILSALPNGAHQIVAHTSDTVASVEEREANERLICEAVSSHAAKDAKIRELEGLLLECVRDMTAAHIVDNILHKEKHPTRPELPEPASLIAARAALALPCAPQES